MIDNTPNDGPTASSEVADPVPTAVDPMSAVPPAEQIASAEAVGVTMADPTPPVEPDATVPDATVPEAYDLKLGDEAVTLTTEEAQIFKDLGLTNDNAQKLVQFFADKIAPDLAQAHHEVETTRLMQQWGIQDKALLTERIDALRSWGDKTLPPALVKELGRTASGITALYSMMQSGAAPAAANAAQPAATREQLQSMVNDPRYWDGDPAYRKQVEQYASRVQ